MVIVRHVNPFEFVVVAALERSSCWPGAFHVLTACTAPRRWRADGGGWGRVARTETRLPHTRAAMWLAAVARP